MLYLKNFTFPDAEEEQEFFYKMMFRQTCYDLYYPFQLLPLRGFERIDFDPVTILYGGNGSGKSTVLNIIAEKTGVQRESLYNKTNFFIMII